MKTTSMFTLLYELLLKPQVDDNTYMHIDINKTDYSKLPFIHMHYCNLIPRVLPVTQCWMLKKGKIRFVTCTAIIM